MTGKAKLQVYMILFSVVVSLICIVFMRPGRHQAASGANQMTAEQKLNAIEKALPESSAASKFARQAETAQQANDEALNSFDQKTP